MALAQAARHGKPLRKVLQVTALMQTLAFSEFAWHQNLACMQGHCHATERQRTGLQITGSQMSPRPRFRQARLRTTPFGHAFRPRFSATLFSHAFQPRLSATPSGHVFRRTIRIEDVMYSAELVAPLIFGAVQR